MSDINYQKERVGQINKNKYGSAMIVEEYINSRNILVRFIESGYLTSSTWQNFSRGKVVNPYNKTLYGVGYIGDGEYTTRGNGKLTRQYVAWKGMLRRCYSYNQQKEFPSYVGCSVVEEWHNFQNFAKWYEDNYYEVDNGRMSLDKDILIKGNKLYSPINCIFVPSSINTLFIKRDAGRGGLPLGVTYEPKQIKKYAAHCANRVDGKSSYLGSYYTPFEAFEVYKEFKEKLIKSVADVYKHNIPSRLYEAMLKYEVEITD